MSPLPEFTDVLVCGAGPVGLAAAISLHHRDPVLNITVVEARENATTELRAVVIHAATLEVGSHLPPPPQIIY